jgi:hypothetical protein
MLNDDKPPYTLQHPPVFDTLDSDDVSDTHYLLNAWLPRPQRYNLSIGTDKGVPAILS